MIPKPRTRPVDPTALTKHAGVRYRLFLVLHHVALVCLLALVPMPHAGASETTEVMIGGERFNLELAVDSNSRNRGLMFRDRIDADGGMLFVFPDLAARSFWMKNCLVDMDILFLDNDGVVVRTTQMFTEPLQQEGESISAYHQRLRRYPSGSPAQFAIELRHGTATRLGIEAGQRIELDIEKLTSMAR